MVELVLVIALLGIMGLAVRVMAPSVSLARLNMAAKQVLSDMEYARQNAQLTGVVSGVSFVQNGSYTVYQATTATPLKSPLNRTDMVLTLSSAYPGISLSKTYVVEFNSFGVPSTGGGGNITITDGTNTRTITVTANTGKMVLQ